MKKRILYWLQNDLRIDDNAILTSLQDQHCELDIVFVIEPRWFKASNYQQKPYGEHKFRFLIQSLHALEHALFARGQTLHVIEGEPITVLKQRIEQQAIEQVFYSQQIGLYEQRQLSTLQTLLPKVTFLGILQDTLLQEHELPCALAELPTSFTPFRKQIEAQHIAINTSLVSSERLPPPITLCAQKPLAQWLETDTCDALLQGGLYAATEHCKQYFSSRSASSYKLTRNALDGFATTTKFSPWLAFGCISARQIYQAVEVYEQQVGSNESTYWIKFELLWREFFKWHALQVKQRLFSFKGQRKTKPLTTFIANRFMQWCHGNTPYPLVNAIMHELNTTGYIANRSRQIAASCLVNELQVDWRYGAAYFEQQLIDYDVAVNWGNWQYIAGVGADPRGGRHFNIAKQTAQFDPEHRYVKKWAGNTQCPPHFDDVDAADWPTNEPSH
ncbi:DASH family cryptochrome [Pseudoalteromonas mariniglutinosa]|uniref:DASH family cryptochrome n=1 Tax=Pseudoalteromonas mariniglutinosa TaxID=206042 RepID=UPI00384CF874